MTMSAPYSGVNNPFISGTQADEEDAEHFFITEDEVYSASADVDLKDVINDKGLGEAPSHRRSSTGSGSGSGNTLMEALELTTSNMVSSATMSPGDDGTLGGGTIGSNTGGNSGDEADIEDEYGVHIDEEIVDDILRSSEDRIREQENQTMKKYCMFGMIIFAVFMISIAMLDPDLMVRRDIQNHGSAYHYDDKETFRSGSNGQKDEQMVLNEHMPFNEEEYKPYFVKASEVLGPPFNPALEEIPFFFRVPSVSSIVEDTFSRCLGLVIASDKPGPPGLPRDELLMYDMDDSNGSRKYLNVDLSTGEGIKRAGALNLASSELAEVLISPFLHFPLDALFSPEVNARLFTVVRHPVDWAISLYYDFTQNAVEGVLQSMTLQEFIDSNYYEGNILTRVLWHGYGPEIPTVDQLHLAQEILRTKFVIGLHDELQDSITLFEDYFFWENGNDPGTVSCKREQQKVENQREFDMYHEVGFVRAGSTVHQRIVEQNDLDLQLYWYAVDLHRAQRAWIPTREKAREIE